MTGKYNAYLFLASLELKSSSKELILFVFIKNKTSIEVKLFYYSDLFYCTILNKLLYILQIFFPTYFSQYYSEWWIEH